jgi:cell division protein FtsL
MEGNESIKPESVKPERPAPPPAPVEEKKEFLARAEVKTMGKDISMVRERESLEQKERLSKLNIDPQRAAKMESKEDETRAKEAIKNGVLTPKNFKRPSSFQKVAIRLLAVLILILAAGFIYWFFEIRLTEGALENIEQNEAPEEETQDETATESETLPEEEPEFIITQSPADWGYKIPDEPRLVDTIMLLSVYNTSADPYNIEEILESFKKNGMLTHYIISRTGEIIQLAPDEVIAYHSGNTQMPDGTRRKEMNLYSIGIALAYEQTEAPNEVQLLQLKALVNSLIAEFQIPTANIFTRQETSLTGSATWNFDKETFINSLTQ